MFGTAAAVIAVMLLAYAVLVQPVWGWLEYRRLVARRELRSASLLLPVVLHALIDLRAFLLLRPGAASPSSPG